MSRLFALFALFAHIVARMVARCSDLIDRAVILLLRSYQWALSPLFAGLGAQCRFEPSCSRYMIDAVQSRGALVGVGLGLWRLARCNPFSSGGYDPAPVARGTTPSQGVSRETV